MKYKRSFIIKKKWKNVSNNKDWQYAENVHRVQASSTTLQIIFTIWTMPKVQRANIHSYEDDAQ